jgi:hypothetical protein
MDSRLRGNDGGIAFVEKTGGIAFAEMTDAVAFVFAFAFAGNS